MGRLKVAVVGAGISGLAAAWLLSARHQVALYEQEARPGGHAHTVDVATRDGTVAVDTGFIVYNLATYPNLIALLAHLGVATAPAPMTFAVSLDGGAYEYNGNNLVGLLGGAGNLVRPDHWRMLADIFRFFREAPALAGTEGEAVTLGEYLIQERYSRAFIDRHILPMAAAIWSCPSETMLEFPAAAFARFFANHGLLQVQGRPQWRTVVGGSRVYVERLLGAMRAPPRLSARVTSIRRDASSVRIADSSGHVESFDRVVVATHADQALRLLADADPLERELLGAFGYSQNIAVLHRDPALMPRRRRLWSSWNYVGHKSSGADRLSVSYWMNSLQPLATEEDLFVTLNPAVLPAANLLDRRIDYAHPVLDARAMAAQRRLWELQGRRRVWFAGSYFGYGFHEDGLQSALLAAEELGGVERPWRVADPSGRVLARREARPIAQAAE